VFGNSFFVYGVVCLCYWFLEGVAFHGLAVVTILASAEVVFVPITVLWAEVLCGCNSKVMRVGRISLFRRFFFEVE